MLDLTGYPKTYKLANPNNLADIYIHLFDRLFAKVRVNPVLVAEAQKKRRGRLRFQQPQLDFSLSKKLKDIQGTGPDSEIFSYLNPAQKSRFHSANRFKNKDQGGIFLSRLLSYLSV